MLCALKIKSESGLFSISSFVKVIRTISGIHSVSSESFDCACLTKALRLRCRLSIYWFFCFSVHMVLFRFLA